MNGGLKYEDEENTCCFGCSCCLRWAVNACICSFRQNEVYTQPISELGINGGDGLWNRGDLYGIGTSDGIEKLISITGIDAKKWRSTGEFSYSDVTVNGEVDWNNLGLYHNANELFNWADDGSETAIYPFDFNGTDEITIRNTSFDRNGWMYVTDDGYILNVNNGTIKGDCRGFSYEQVGPDGEFDFVMTNCSGWSCSLDAASNKYNAYFMYFREPQNIDESNDADEYDIKAVGIKKDCTEEEIYSTTAMNGWRIWLWKRICSVLDTECFLCGGISSFPDRDPGNDGLLA